VGNEVLWIKLSTKVFDDEKIKLLDALPDHDALIVIWFKLLVQAGKSNREGWVMIDERIPATPEDLATLFNRPVTTVKFALEAFTRLSMVEIEHSGIYLPNYGKHQAIEKLEQIAAKERAQRERDRQRKQLSRLSGIVRYRDRDGCCFCGARGGADGAPEGRGGGDTGLRVGYLVLPEHGGAENSDNMGTICGECFRDRGRDRLLAFLNRSSRINKEIVSKHQGLKLLVVFNVKHSRWLGLKSADVTVMSRDSHGTVRRTPDTELDSDSEEEIEKERGGPGRSGAAAPDPLPDVPYQEIVETLNGIAGKHFRHDIKPTREKIRARVKEGATRADFTAVIVEKSRQWKDDPKMRGCIRPETLFGTKFWTYRAEAEARAETGKPRRLLVEEPAIPCPACKVRLTLRDEMGRCSKEDGGCGEVYQIVDGNPVLVPVAPVDRSSLPRAMRNPA
jgi:predicted phage replisome organizer/uncharacterized phage protein (TIGR02220 family)